MMLIEDNGDDDKNSNHRFNEYEKADNSKGNCNLERYARAGIQKQIGRGKLD